MSPRGRRIWGGVAAASLLGASALAVDAFLDAARQTGMAQVVRECGGNMGSVPAGPVGTEFRVRFDRPLTAAELDRLRGLNSLRGVVMVAFVGCELTPEQVARTRRALPNCRLFRVVNHKSLQLLPE